jgi:hypothetical protein
MRTIGGVTIGIAFGLLPVHPVHAVLLFVMAAALILQGESYE